MEHSEKTRYSLLTRNQPRTPVQWRPGIRRFPIFAALTILAFLVCTLGCVAIIVFSDNKPVASWKVGPAVLLAIVIGMANAALGATFSQAAMIAWWRAALQGAELAELHYIWSFGRFSFRPTLRLSRRVVQIALVAAVVTLTTLVDSPLLQRATRVKNGLMHSNVALSIDLMKDPLAQSYGLIQVGVPSNTFLLTNFLAQVQTWYNGTNIMASNETGYVCHGTCDGFIAVPGLEANCSTATTYLNLQSKANEGQAMFSINFSPKLNSDGDTVLGLDVMRSDSVSQDCVATMIQEHCDIGTALVERQVTIENGSITFRHNSQQLLARYHSQYDAVEPVTGTMAGPLDMLNWLGTFYFQSNFTIDLELGNNVASQANGIVPVGQKYQNTTYDASAPSCAYTFFSPTADIIHAMEDVLFRVAFDPGISMYDMETQSFQASQATPALVFHSNYKYLAIAVLTMAIGLAVTLIPLWGWWQLGRTVDMSPLEIANAFGAPLMRKSTVHNDASDIVAKIGDIRVKYGEVVLRTADSSDTVTRLEIEADDSVMMPDRRQPFTRRTSVATVTTIELPKS